MQSYLDLIDPSTNQKHYPDLGSDASSVQNFCTVSFLTHFLGLYLVQFSSQQKSYEVYIVSGFVLFFEQIIQGLFKDFWSHISHFLGTSNSVQKRALSLSFFCGKWHVISHQYRISALSRFTLIFLGYIQYGFHVSTRAIWYMYMYSVHIQIM